MASQTTNLKLVKPAANDNIDISQINGNMDKIDTAVKGVQDSISKATLTSGIIMAEGYTVATGTTLRSNGQGTATLHLGFKPTSSMAAGTRVNVATLPDEAVPAFHCLLSSYNAHCSVLVSRTGEVLVTPYSAVTAGESVFVGGTYAMVPIT